MKKYYVEFGSQPKMIGLFFIFILNGVIIGLTPGHFSTWWLVLAGMVLFSVSEYSVHRFLLHEFPNLMPKSYEGHVAHHEHPNDARYIFGPFYFDLVIYAIIYAGMLWITRNLHATALLAIGFAFFHINYQWVHYVSHRPIIPIVPWNRWLKRMHLLHHFKDEHLWYGVTDPAWDMLTGTYEKVKRKNTKYLRKQLKSWYSSKFH
ncbi:MAG TPA: sterol desaturase family protein [Bacillales bacterium]|nr:sterol desaturase family protein [Bacillales bacterium]